jgi:uncharacterized protein (DUF2147 family)
MKQMVITILTSFLLAPGAATDDISGIWLTQKKDSRIEITRNPDGSYTGKIVWAEPPHQDYVGTTVMKGVEYDSGLSKYTCPWIYDPRIGVTAHGTITVNGDTLNVKAYKGILSKMETFTRVK